MSSNQENIEAKLAAYIDGELKGADREEIERHLAANPQHRKLIGELSRTRTVLQSLPRVKAPSDVMDSLQSQLERSALLGSPEQLAGEDSYKIGFWTQFRGIAAILMLTMGLAAVVYYVLPRGEPKVEMAGGASREKPVSVEETAKIESSKIGLDRDVNRTAERVETASKGGFSEPRGKDGTLAPGAADSGMHQQLQTAAAGPITVELQQQLTSNGINAQNYIVCDTTDSSAANAAVSNYLNYQRVTWEQVPTLALAQTEHSLNKLELSKMLTSPMTVANELERQSLDKTKSLDQVASAKMTADDEAKARDLRSMSPADSARMDVSPQAIQLQKAGPKYNASNMIVARSLSRKQVEELSGLLTQSSGIVSNYSPSISQQQWAGNIPPANPAPVNAAGAAPASQVAAVLADAATQPTVQRIKVGDTLTLVIPDSGMGEVVITSTVDPAGIAPGVPRLGGMIVSGLTLDELNESILSRARENTQVNQVNNNAMTPPIRATRITSPPAETAKEAAAQVDAVTGGMQMPAGQQMGAQIAPGDDRGDVVIIVRDVVLQPAPTAPAATQPSTQP